MIQNTKVLVINYLYDELELYWFLAKSFDNSF